MFKLAGLRGYVEENAPNPPYGAQKDKERIITGWGASGPS